MKTCTKCGLEKDLSDYYRNSRQPDGYRSDCKTCHTSVVRRYQATAYGKVIAKLSDKKRTGSIKRKLSHNRAGIKYKKTDKGRRTTLKASIRRRDLSKGFDIRLTAENINEIYSRFNNQCFNCGSKNNLTIDHHKPLSGGFGLSIDNAVILCNPCNASKCDRMPQEFYKPYQLEILNGLGII